MDCNKSRVNWFVKRLRFYRASNDWPDLQLTLDPAVFLAQNEPNSEMGKAYPDNLYRLLVDTVGKFSNIHEIYLRCSYFATSRIRL